ncbi:hypothetical protein K491DRAFT_696498 [Lophiostoma macrostomum CBS 122681]|uniref:Uncharacterized protein n=1 Tax=Lophiostoma macrostomum CBS 122681 TaxID=1314788 RepID=A0A6A6SXR2_9PLEO|nr:hypothetical protein K491DRAFT_696498 [Lophiostoma macrostomum CBS 122681]
MAGLLIASPTLHLVSASRHEFLAIAQAPRIRRRLPPIYSRASCSWSWSRPKLSQPPLVPLRLQRPAECHPRQSSLFSTCLALQHPDNGEKPQVPDQGNGKIPLSTPTSPKKPRHENIYNIPNILTFSRLLATPAIGYLIITHQPLHAFNLFLYAGFSDLLDGWIARKWHLQTVVGSVVDPMADKALMTTLVTCLALNGSLSVPLATLILGRDVSLAIAAIYYRYASLPRPKTLARYWDFSLPSAEVHPTTISKFNTFLQLGLIGTTMCVALLQDPVAVNSAAGGLLQSVRESLGGEEGVRSMVQWMSAVVASTTMYSGLSYVWTKDAVTILGDNEALKRKQGFRGRMIIGSSYGVFIVVAAWLVVREWVQSEEDAMNENRQ